MTVTRSAFHWGLVCFAFCAAAVGHDLKGANASELPNRVFSSDSFWYRPIPREVALHPNSVAFVEDFQRQIKKFYGNVTINATAYSSPVYVVDAATPTVKVTQWDCHKSGYFDKQFEVDWQAVPIPDYALPSSGTDAEMTIFQPSTNTMWEFWRARKTESGWEACWGGRMANVSQSKGIWTRRYGTTATGLPFVGGQLTVEELRRGRIDHVMGITLVETENWDKFSWPANRSDGYNPNKLPNRIQEGQRLRLDPSVDVERLKLHPIAKIIARAAQTYGFVVWDRGGSIALRAENVRQFTAVGKPNPYPELWGRTPVYSVLAGFPWDRLQFLPVDYGKQGH